MPDYSIFGGCLRSEITFPELRALGEPCREASWTLETTTTIPEHPDAEALGELMIVAGCRVRMLRHPDGFRLQYDDSGTYDITESGRRITWRPGPNPAPVTVRSDVTGRVMATALYASGRACLHGSAVSLPGGVVAFVAPKYHGKSTLALALARAGGRLLTDDVLAVELSDPPMAMPGVHLVKLWTDSAEMFGVERETNAGEKHLVHDLPDEMLMFDRAPLAAVYLLAPLAEGESMEAPARRVRMAGVPSTLALVRHTAVADLLGGSEAPVVFERATALAGRVPVYRLDTVPGLDRLSAIVSHLLEWHGETAGLVAAHAP